MIVDSLGNSRDRLQGAGRRQVASAIVQSPTRHICSLNWLETMIVVESRASAVGADETLLILAQLAVEILPLEAMHMHEAHEAWRRYGKVGIPRR